MINILEIVANYLIALFCFLALLGAVHFWRLTKVKTIIFLVLSIVFSFILRIFRIVELIWGGNFFSEHASTLTWVTWILASIGWWTLFLSFRKIYKNKGKTKEDE